MRKTGFMAALALIALAGCEEAGVNDPRRVDDASGYAKYAVAREAALQGRAPTPHVIPRARPFDAPTAAQIQGPTAYQILRREVRAVPVAVAPRARGQGAYVDPDTGAVVTSQPVVEIAPEAAPGAVVVAAAPPEPRVKTPDSALTRYAFANRHAVGTVVYPRTGASTALAARACARHPSPASAQLAFMAAGGPTMDPAGMDPDGDGFVCGWNPAPYRVDPL